MLSPANRGYGSTCQAVGMNIGYFLSYTIFLALSSAKFCNSYLRSTPCMLSTHSFLNRWFDETSISDILCVAYMIADVGLLTLSEFMFGAGCIYLIVTVAVAFGKAEAPEVGTLSLTITLFARSIIVSASCWQLHTYEVLICDRSVFSLFRC
jgi:hypothetical protein